MTLTRQIISIFLVALVLLFVGTFFISIFHIKAYYEVQLNNNAQDTATALGLTLSKQLEENDKQTLLLAKVKAVFEQGYFSKIQIYDNNKQLIISREIKHIHTAIPRWFTQFIALESEPQSALLMKGWKQEGVIKVTSNAALAYKAMWQTTVYLFWLFLTLTLCLSLIGILLLNKLMSPLNQITQQAKDIGARNFYTLNIPIYTKELKKLSAELNKMATQLQLFFADQLQKIEKYHQKAFMDTLTKLGNRRYFFQNMDAFLKSDDGFKPGHLMLIKISGFSNYNKKYSFHQGDKVLLKTTEIIIDQLQGVEYLMLSRLEGPHFAFIVTDKPEFNINEFSQTLYDAIEQYIKTMDEVFSLSLSVTRYYFNMHSTDLMQQADKNLHLAQSNKIPFIPTSQHTHLCDLTEKSEKQMLVAIKNKQFELFYQPVQSDKTIFHYEIYIKLLLDQSLIPASVFLPLADNHHLSITIDNYTLEQIVENKSTDQTYAINLTSALISDPIQQKKWLAILSEHPNLHKKIHFEISEFILLTNKQETLSLIHKLHDMEFMCGFDQVGAYFDSFDVIKNSPIQYLKLNEAITKDLSKSNEELIKNLMTSSEYMGFELIATHIESQSQWRQLQGLGIKWFQGNYIAKAQKNIIR